MYVHVYLQNTKQYPVSVTPPFKPYIAVDYITSSMKYQIK